MTRNIETAAASSSVASCQLTPLGSPMLGTPLGTGPSVETWWAWRLNAQLATTAPTTETNPPGTALTQRSHTTSTASTDTDTAAVGHDAWPRWPRVLRSPIRSPLMSGRSEVYLGMPSMPPTWPVATWIPTPVRKPTSTVRDRKSARKPRRATRASHSSPARQQRAQPSQGDPLRRGRLEPGDPEAGDPGEHDRGRGRVRPDDQVPRRPEQREGGDRDQDRVQAGDDRHPGDLGIAHGLGDRQRGQGDRGDDVALQPTPLVRPDPVQDRHIAPEARALGALHRHRFHFVNPLLSLVAPLAHHRTGRERAKDVNGLTGVPGREERAPRSSPYVFILLG